MPLVILRRVGPRWRHLARDSRLPRRWGVQGHVLLLSGLCLASSHASAQTGSGPTRFDATPQRPTFTTDTSTTAPGTLELELGAAVSTGLLVVPQTIKFTPDVEDGVLHRGEISVAFDALASVAAAGRRETDFGDRLAIAFRRPVYSNGSVSVALAPEATVLLRGEAGLRVGAMGILASSFGRNAAVLNVGLSGATAASTTNPARDFFVAADLARTVGATGRLENLAVFAGALYENDTNDPASFSLGQGLSYRLRPNLVLDVAISEHGLAHGSGTYEIHAGLTFNLGRPGDW